MKEMKFKRYPSNSIPCRRRPGKDLILVRPEESVDDPWTLEVILLEVNRVKKKIRIQVIENGIRDDKAEYLDEGEHLIFYAGEDEGPHPDDIIVEASKVYSHSATIVVGNNPDKWKAVRGEALR